MEGAQESRTLRDRTASAPDTASLDYHAPQPFASPNVIDLHAAVTVQMGVAVFLEREAGASEQAFQGQEPGNQESPIEIVQLRFE